MHDPLSKRPVREAVWHDVPLPGLHSCLTWQFNLTVHPFLDTLKFVSILRDPDAQVELARTGSAGLVHPLAGYDLAHLATGTAFAALRTLSGHEAA